MTTGPTWTGEVVNLAAKGERLELPALVMTDGRYLVLCREGVTLPGWDHCLTWEAMLEELSASRQVITA